MIAAYYPNGNKERSLHSGALFRGGTLHKVRPDKQLPTPPAGEKRAKCGQILWKKDTKFNPRDKNEDFMVCRKCFPGGDAS